MTHTVTDPRNKIEFMGTDALNPLIFLELDTAFEVSKMVCTISVGQNSSEIWQFQIVKLRSLVSHTEWSNISERNSNLIENLKKGPEMTL